mmetsp:Transcript_4392/g.17994  ORF Transcript_4392/g.17994 Transcript_4392/m.17994 type:complete len:268 (-) Transcript_4392:754-1557(-)
MLNVGTFSIASIIAWCTSDTRRAAMSRAGLPPSSVSACARISSRCRSTLDRCMYRSSRSPLLAPTSWGSAVRTMRSMWCRHRFACSANSRRRLPIMVLAASFAGRAACSSIASEIGPGSPSRPEIASHPPCWPKQLLIRSSHVSISTSRAGRGSSYPRGSTKGFPVVPELSPGNRTGTAGASSSSLTWITPSSSFLPKYDWNLFVPYTDLSLLDSASMRVRASAWVTAIGAVNARSSGSIWFGIRSNRCFLWYSLSLSSAHARASRR